MELEDENDLPASESGDNNARDFGDLRGRGRRGEQNTFIEGGRDIMVATKGFGMGIDKPNIRLIVHRTPPGNLEAYVQEAGRAGRDGDLADAILYYSPDRPKEGEYETRSDYEIQELFLTERYIRRCDVVVMRAFLKTVERRVGSFLYFTNDEAISFFDSCMLESAEAALGLEEPYRWPGFPSRQRRGYESGEHEEILDRGHLYQEKTQYLERILAVLYRIRPDLHDQKKRLAFIEQVQETGVQIVRPSLKNAANILNSNSYFGELLRKAGLTPEQLRDRVRHCEVSDMLTFAELLNLAPSETAAMFRDHKCQLKRSRLYSRRFQKG